MRKVIALILIALVLVSGTALAVEENPIVTVYDLVGYADAYHKQAASLEAVAAYELSMAVEGERFDMAFDADIKYIVDPLQMQVKMRVPEAGKVEIYAQRTKDALELYAVSDSETDMLTILFSDELIELFTTAASQQSPYRDLAYLGTEKRNGRSEYVISASMDMSGMGDFSQLFLYVLTDAMDVLENSPNIPVKLYIDTKTGAYSRVEIDMAGFTKALIASASDEEITINKYTAAVDYKYNSLKRLTIPASVIRKANK